jgi:hypothetical protein
MLFFGKNFPRPHLRSNPPSACGLPTKCMWASHQYLVDIPVIFILQPGSIEAGVSPMSNVEEQSLLIFDANWTGSGFRFPADIFLCFFDQRPIAEKYRGALVNGISADIEQGSDAI